MLNSWEVYPASLCAGFKESAPKKLEEKGLSPRELADALQGLIAVVQLSASSDRQQLLGIQLFQGAQPKGGNLCQMGKTSQGPWRASDGEEDSHPLWKPLAEGLKDLFPNAGVEVLCRKVIVAEKKGKPICRELFQVGKRVLEGLFFIVGADRGSLIESNRGPQEESPERVPLPLRRQRGPRAVYHSPAWGEPKGELVQKRSLAHASLPIEEHEPLPIAEVSSELLKELLSAEKEVILG